MANANTKAATAAAPAAPVAAPAAPASPILVVSLPATFKAPRASSARGQWLAALQAHNGKTLAQFTASVTASPPSLQPKGKYGLAGQVEPVQGWVSWFTRQGVLTLQAPK